MSDHSAFQFPIAVESEAQLEEATDELKIEEEIQPSADAERPDRFWKTTGSLKHRCEPWTPPKLTGFPSHREVRFVCISDTHNKLGAILNKIPPGDVLIHAGDFSYRGALSEVQRFNEEMGKLPHKIKIVVAGNHDLTFDTKRDDFRDINGKLEEELKKLGVKHASDLLTNCIYLEDSSVDVFGFKVYGAPWQPEFCGWGFNVERGKKILEKWKKIPTDTDILITHGPPVGHGDITKFGKNHVGCVDLLNVVEKRVKPMYHIFGHIHEGYGSTTNGETVFINASTCDIRYSPSQEPIMFQLDIRPGHKKKFLELNNSCTIVP